MESLHELKYAWHQPLIYNNNFIYLRTRYSSVMLEMSSVLFQIWQREKSRDVYISNHKIYRPLKCKMISWLYHWIRFALSIVPNEPQRFYQTSNFAIGSDGGHNLLCSNVMLHDLRTKFDSSLSLRRRRGGCGYGGVCSCGPTDRPLARLSSRECSWLRMPFPRLKRMCDPALWIWSTSEQEKIEPLCFLALVLRSRWPYCTCSCLSFTVRPPALSDLLSTGGRTHQFWDFDFWKEW